MGRNAGLSVVILGIAASSIAQATPRLHLAQNGGLLPADACRTRIEQVMSASGAPTAQQGVSVKGNSVWIERGIHVGDCRTESGFVRYFNSSLHHMTAAPTPVPTRAQMMSVVDGLAQRLEAAGLMSGAELDRANARWSDFTIGASGGQGEAVYGPFVLGRTVTIRRAISGIPVVNSGLSVSIDNHLRITRVHLGWRPVAAWGPNVALLGNSRARASLPSGVDVAQEELAYIDRGERAVQRYYEPWYVYILSGQDAQGRLASKRLLKHFFAGSDADNLERLDISGAVSSSSPPRPANPTPIPRTSIRP